MATVSINHLPSINTNRVITVTGTSSGPGVISVDLVFNGLIYTSFDAAVDDEGGWNVDVTFQDRYDGVTNIVAHYMNLHNDYASDSTSVDFIAPCLEDDFIIVCPNPRRTNPYSMVATITSKNITDTIYAGIGDMPNYSISGIGEVKIIIANTSFLHIVIPGKLSYDLHYVLLSHEDTQGQGLEILTYAGVQFRNISEHKFTKLQAKQYEQYKIDYNKFYRYI